MNQNWTEPVSAPLFWLVSLGRWDCNNTMICECETGWGEAERDHDDVGAEIGGRASGEAQGRGKRTERSVEIRWGNPKAQRTPQASSGGAWKKRQLYHSLINPLLQTPFYCFPVLLALLFWDCCSTISGFFFVLANFITQLWLVYVFVNTGICGSIEK